MIICGDNDKAGHDLAKSAAEEFRKQGLQVDIHYPEQLNADYNDLLRQGIPFSLGASAPESLHPTRESEKNLSSDLAA